MEVILLKLGGSLITDKTTPYTARPEIIQLVIAEIKRALEGNPNLKLIIGHGAGSFAHQSAKKYNTLNGIHTKEEQLGATIVHYDVTQLNTLFIKECIKQELPVFSLQASAFIFAENKNLKNIDINIILELFKNNIIPCVCGDVIIDSKIGATIFSTDKIFTLLVEKLLNEKISIKQIIHAGDYDGVLDKNNHVIQNISPGTIKHFQESIGTSTTVDVTGGMLQKVTESIYLAEKDIKTLILRGNQKGNILAALTNKVVTGTTISQ